MAKIAIKSEKNHSFGRHIPNHGAENGKESGIKWFGNAVDVFGGVRIENADDAETTDFHRWVRIFPIYL